MAGINDTGFTPKTFTEIRNQITQSMQDVWGVVDEETGEINNVDVSPQSRLGQIADIVSEEIQDVWLAAQDIYNSRYPDTSSGNNLDNVVAINNVQRRPAQPGTVNCHIFSENSNVTIAAGQEANKNIPGDPEIFALNNPASISNDTFAVVTNGVCTSGKVQLSFEGKPLRFLNSANDPSTYDIIDFFWNDTTAEIQTKLNGSFVANEDNEGVITFEEVIQDCTVIGSFNVKGCIIVKLNETTLSIVKPSILETSLQQFGVDQDVSSFFTNENVFGLTSSNTEGLAIPALSVVNVLGSDINFSGLINLEPGTPGKPRETDAELRSRRKDFLQQAGQVTNSGMKQKVLNVEGVTECYIIENDTSSVDADGRPEHSFEVYVSGGEDNDVAQAIYDSKPIGIKPVSTSSTSSRSGICTDVNGADKVIDFSSPSGLLIYVHIDMTYNNFFPTPTSAALDGIKQDVIDYIADNYEIVDVGFTKTIYPHSLYTPINLTQGIASLEVGITATAPTPPQDKNKYSAASIPIPTDKYAYATVDSIYIDSTSV